MKRQQLINLLVGVALLTPLSTLADTSKVDGYTIHHNAFATDTLTPEVAKAYGLQRSKFRGMLVVTVRKDAPGTSGTSVPARVEAKSVSLTGQTVRMPMREVKDQKAPYYITDFPIHNQEAKHFVIEVTPRGSHQTFRTEMTQEFFTE
ncbi:MAG: DUF4426 domain-containing protein [Chromatiaceae bacterium]|jgi:hypothetical protein